LLCHYGCAHHHGHAHDFNDDHVYARVYDRACVRHHLFFHDYENDYVFFMNDLINVLNLCDHDVHLLFLQNHRFLLMIYYVCFHGYDHENDLFYLFNYDYDHVHVHVHDHVNDHVNVPQDDNVHHLNEE
jgi:hypothetical protein